jgi:hypothetical protein
MEELLNECRSLRALSPVAESLVRYANSLGISSFEKKGQRYVADPNFVTFEVHSQRTNNLTISLRGNPEEFLDFSRAPGERVSAGLLRGQGD